MADRINQGYVITDSIQIGEMEFVFGKLDSNTPMYVTWACKGGDNYFWGHYFSDLLEAKKCRYIDEYHVEVGTGWDNLYHICQFAEMMERNLYREEQEQNRTFAGDADRRYNDGRVKRERSVGHGTDVQNRGRLSTAQPGGAGGTEGRKIWDAAAQLPSDAQERLLHGDAVERQTERPSGEDRPGGRRDGGAADGADGAGAGSDGGTEIVRRDEVGGADEQHPGVGGGSGVDGAGLHRRVSDTLPTEEEQKAAIQAAEDEQSSAFAISQEDIDAALLYGSGVKDSKLRIYERYQTVWDATENVSFLIGEYEPTAYFSIDVEKRVRVWCGPDGLKIGTGDITKPDDTCVTLNWKKVSQRIGQLIEADRYLSPAEKR